MLKKCEIFKCGRGWTDVVVAVIFSGLVLFCLYY